MDEFFSEGNQQDLFEAEGAISEDECYKLEESLGLAPERSVDGEAVTLFREKSRFSIGTPVPLPLKDYLSISGRVGLSEIQAQMKDYEFCSVRLACSFVPAEGSRFHDASFDITLQAVPDHLTTPSLSLQPEAIAYDLFPLKSQDKMEMRITRGGSVVVTGAPSLPSLSIPIPQQGISYEKQISYTEAFGLLGTRPGWRFTRTLSQEISGQYLLLMLVRKPKGTSVQAKFSLTANVEFLIGQSTLDVLLPLILLFRRRGSSSTITDPTVALC